MDMSALAGQRVALTGGSGTLGFHLLEKLSSIPRIRVLALKRSRSSIKSRPSVVELRSIDFFNKRALTRAITDFGPAVVIHCAATTTQFERSHWFDMIRFNVDVTLRLCEAVSHVPPCHFVYVSSGLAYRDQGRLLREIDPLDSRHPYGASKAAADLLLRAASAEFGVPLTILRPFSFTGLADESPRLFPSLLRAAAERQPFDLAPGDHIRDYTAAQDVADGILAACAASTTSHNDVRVFNLGSGDTEPLRTVIERVIAETDLDVVLRFGARDYLPFEPRFLSPDTSLVRETLGWVPKTRLSYAVWQLAAREFPHLRLRQPKETR